MKSDCHTALLTDDVPLRFGETYLRNIDSRLYLWNMFIWCSTLTKADGSPSSVSTAKLVICF